MRAMVVEGAARKELPVGGVGSCRGLGLGPGPAMGPQSQARRASSPDEFNPI